MLNQQTTPGTAPRALDPVAMNGQMTPLSPQEMQHHLMHQTRAYMITKGNGNG